MKLVIDVERSLRECPPMKLTIPDYIKAEFPLLKEPVFIERKILKLSEIKYDPNKQPRALQFVPENVVALKKDFTTNGFRHNERPMVINENLELQLGFNRYPALMDLSVTEYIFDKYDFHGSPVLEKCFSAREEGTAAHREFHTILDITKDIITLLNTPNCLKRNEKSVSTYVDWAYSHKSKEDRNAIKLKVNRTLGGYHTTIRTYHSGSGPFSTMTFAKKYNIGCKGEGNFGPKKSNEYGYITHESTPKTSILDGLKLYYGPDYKSRDKIKLYFYVQKPTSIENLKEQRMMLLTGYRKFIENTFYPMYLSMKPGMSKEEFWKLWPIEVGGFLAQDETPKLGLGGGPKERGIIPVSEIDNNILPFSKKSA